MAIDKTQESKLTPSCPKLRDLTAFANFPNDVPNMVITIWNIWKQFITHITLRFSSHMLFSKTLVRWLGFTDLRNNLVKFNSHVYKNT